MALGMCLARPPLLCCNLPRHVLVPPLLVWMVISALRFPYESPFAHSRPVFSSLLSLSSFAAPVPDTPHSPPPPHCTPHRPTAKPRRRPHKLTDGGGRTRRGQDGRAVVSQSHLFFFRPPLPAPSSDLLVCMMTAACNHHAPGRAREKRRSVGLVPGSPAVFGHASLPLEKDSMRRACPAPPSPPFYPCPDAHTFLYPAPHLHLEHNAIYAAPLPVRPQAEAFPFPALILLFPNPYPALPTPPTLPTGRTKATNSTNKRITARLSTPTA